MKTVHSKKIRTAHFIPTFRYPDRARFIHSVPGRVILRNASYIPTPFLSKKHLVLSVKLSVL